MSWWQCKICKGAPIWGCEHEKPWIGPCPYCGRFVDAKKVGENVVGAFEQKLTALTAASSGDVKFKVKKIPSNVEPLDLVMTGGFVKAQSALLAGLPGSRKSTISLMALEGFSKQTTRPLLYVDAEESEAGVMNICQLNGITSSQVIIHPNDRYDNNLSDIFDRCDQLKPFATVFNSLQPIAQLSGVSTELVAQKIANYCQRTKMIGIIICQLTKGLDFKGGTGASYNVDTLIMFEPFRPSIDGDPVALFGRKVATEIIGYNREMRMLDAVENLRVLVGGAYGKNRLGPINQRTYVFTASNGEMIHLKTRPPQVDEQENPGP